MSMQFTHYNKEVKPFTGINVEKAPRSSNNILILPVAALAVVAAVGLYKPNDPATSAQHQGSVLAPSITKKMFKLAQQVSHKDTAGVDISSTSVTDAKATGQSEWHFTLVKPDSNKTQVSNVEEMYVSGAVRQNGTLDVNHITKLLLSSGSTSVAMEIVNGKWSAEGTELRSPHQVVDVTNEAMGMLSKIATNSGIVQQHNTLYTG